MRSQIFGKLFNCHAIMPFKQFSNNLLFLFDAKLLVINTNIIQFIQHLIALIQQTLLRQHVFTNQVCVGRLHPLNKGISRSFAIYLFVKIIRRDITIRIFPNHPSKNPALCCLLLFSRHQWSNVIRNSKIKQFIQLIRHTFPMLFHRIWRSQPVIINRLIFDDLIQFPLLHLDWNSPVCFVALLKHEVRLRQTFKQFRRLGVWMSRHFFS